MIRPATLFDLLNLWPLNVALVGEESAMELNAGREPYASISTDDADSWALHTAVAINNPLVSLLVSESRGSLDGFMLSSVNTRPFGEPRIYGEVHSFYVTPASRKQNGGTVGGLLKAKTEEWFRSKEIKNIEIACVPANLKRWEAEGFHVTSYKLAKVLE